MAARRGKIARLPWEVRKTDCAMIADGRPAREVCEFVNSGDALSSKGIAPLTEQNVSEWRAGGQREWEQNMAAASRLAKLNEASLHLVEASGGDPSAVGSRILAGRLAEMLESLGDGDAVPLARALSSLRQAETAAAKLELDRRRADLSEEALRLEREKFRWQAASSALKLFEDRRAADIAADRGLGTEEKTERLGRLMFGDLWEGAEDGR